MMRKKRESHRTLSWLGQNPGQWPASDRIYLQQRMLTDGFVPPYTGEHPNEWMPKITGYIRWLSRQRLPPVVEFRIEQ